MLKISDTNAIPQIVQQLTAALQKLKEQGQPTSLDLKFKSLPAAFNFRDSVYSTRSFLRTLYKDKTTNEYSAYTAMHRLLEQTTLSRVTRTLFEQELAAHGHFTIRVRSIDDKHADTLAQLEAIISVTPQSSLAEQEQALTGQEQINSDLYDIPLLGIQIPRDLVVAYQATEALDWLASQPTSSIADYNAGLLPPLANARFSSKIKLIRENPSWFLIDPFALYSETEDN